MYFGWSHLSVIHAGSRTAGGGVTSVESENNKHISS